MAVWQIISFQGYAISTSVTRLKVHKKSGQLYYFLDNIIPEKLKAFKLYKRSILKTWFAYNCKYYNGKELLYFDFSSKYMYLEKSGK